VGSGLTAVYFSLMINRVFFGRLNVSLPQLGTPVDTLISGVKWRDRLPALALVLLIFAFGLQPEWMTRWMESTTTTFVSTAQQVAVQSGEKPQMNNAL